MSLHLMLSNHDFMTHLYVVPNNSPKDHRLHNNIISIMEMIGYLMKKVDGRIINGLMSEVQGILKTIAITFSKDILENYKL